ncbi:MAG TPA: UDP-N-acetylmuramoyl-tripeptide--D-alanyl-D-alanine ligase [Ignavibacteriaceae bacterium]|nr:UDP-N-acetylmuramoyl-tripeptide--D-alanyl-D-alanine ligase [Ignavibacteriaceae bacterium]
MKKIRLTLEDIFEIPGAVIYNPDNFRSVNSVSIDSRNIKRKSLFIAIKGEKFDGHDFINEVVKKGASAIMINERKYKYFTGLELPLITVKNTTASLGEIAKTWRRKLNAKVIGITGSAGKTSTKELLASILSEKYKVNKTKLNNNNHIGVPLTILSTSENHEVLVLEHGTNHFGEISYTADIANPDYALITNIGDSHLEFLKNKKGVFKEKAALFSATMKNSGTLFVNYDEPQLIKAVRGYKKKITYSFDSKTDVRGRLLGPDEKGKEKIEIKYKNHKISGSFLYGEQNAKNLLASSTVAFRLGVTKTQIINGIKKFKNVNRRLNVKNYNNNFTMIDDSYNANPDSSKLALELLNKISKGRKTIALLGDMLELGSVGAKYHKDLAPVINRNKIDKVITIGRLMKSLNKELKAKKIDCRHFSSRSELRRYLRSLGHKNSVVLIKGSRGMKMEEFVKTIEDKISG